jgi:hypothetical protein
MKPIVLARTLHNGRVLLLNQVIPIIRAVQQKIGSVGWGTYDAYVLITKIPYLKILLSVFRNNDLGNNILV